MGYLKSRIFCVCFNCMTWMEGQKISKLGSSDSIRGQHQNCENCEKRFKWQMLPTDKVGKVQKSWQKGICSVQVTRFLFFCFRCQTATWTGCKEKQFATWIHFLSRQVKNSLDNLYFTLWNLQKEFGNNSEEPTVTENCFKSLNAQKIFYLN